jgi:hypothetical protein
MQQIYIQQSNPLCHQVYQRVYRKLHNSKLDNPLAPTVDLQDYAAFIEKDVAAMADPVYRPAHLDNSLPALHSAAVDTLLAPPPAFKKSVTFATTSSSPTSRPASPPSPTQMPHWIPPTPSAIVEDDILDGPCLLHKNSKHTMRECMAARIF